MGGGHNQEFLFPDAFIATADETVPYFPTGSVYVQRQIHSFSPVPMQWEKF